MLDLARRHREPKGPLAIASGSVRRLVTRTLEALGITDWFAAVVAAEDTARHKPEPDVFLEAARRIGAEPAACTVYEDTDIGLEAARRAGMTPVDVRPLIRDAAAAAQLRTRLPPRCRKTRRSSSAAGSSAPRSGTGVSARLHAQVDLPARQDVADDRRPARASPATISWNASLSTM